MVKIEFTPLSLDRKIFPFKKGFKKLSQDPMEKAPLQFIKYSLGVHKKSSNIGSWGETGRYPQGITILKQAVSAYFNNLALKGDNGTLL